MSIAAVASWLIAAGCSTHASKAPSSPKGARATTSAATVSGQQRCQALTRQQVEAALGDPVTNGTPTDPHNDDLEAVCSWKSRSQKGHVVYVLELGLGSFNTGRDVYGIDVADLGDDAWTGGLDGGPFLNVRQGSRVLQFEIDVPGLDVETAQPRLVTLATAALATLR
jgi:hypothetical protein